MTASFDVVVVGAGACGGMAAHRLAELGLRAVVLEAGPEPGAGPAGGDGPARGPRWRTAVDRLTAAGAQLSAVVTGAPLDRDIHLRAAADDPFAARQPVQSACVGFSPANAHLFVDDLDHPYMAPSGQPYYWIRGRQVGGRAHTWTRGAVRMRDVELDAPARDGLGPAWPLRASDLRAHYERAERALAVRGPVEWGAEPYPDALAAAPLSDRERAIVDAIRAGVPEVRADRQPIVRFPLAERSGADLARAAAELRPNAIATEVVMDRGRARGVRYIDAVDRTEHVVEASVVMLCASTLESTRLLMLSRSDAWPAGLANRSGVLGHYLMDHMFGVGVLGVSGARPDQETPPLYVHPFRNVDAASARADFARGYQVLIIRGARRMAALRRFQATLNVSAQGEVLPVRDNRVSLDESVVDAWGVPVLRVQVARTDNERAMTRDMLAMCERIAAAAGFDVVLRSPEPLAPGLTAHETGTARMGDDPASSVVNAYGQTWDVPNLYVTDGAVFPTSGCQNPTLTMMAITSRACDHIAAELGALRG